MEDGCDCGVGLGATVGDLCGLLRHLQLSRTTAKTQKGAGREHENYIMEEM